MELDARKLIDYYHGLGFLGVQITPEVEATMDIGHVRSCTTSSRAGSTKSRGRTSPETNPHDGQARSLTESQTGRAVRLRHRPSGYARMKAYYGARAYPVGVEQKLYEGRAAGVSSRFSTRCRTTAGSRTASARSRSRGRHHQEPA